MSERKLRPPSSGRSQTTESIPEGQYRAVDRRHALNEQQRTYRGPHRPPTTSPRRPPS